MNYILETERLKLRPFTLEDAPFIIELMNSPGWLQFIGDRNVKTEEQAMSYLLNGPLKSYKENNFGLWMVEKISDQKPLGMCGLVKRDMLNNPDIGFAFLPAYNGQGFAYESASAVMSYAKNNLNIPKVSAITLANNTRSIRLLEKIGLKFSGIIPGSANNEELMLFNNF